MVVDIAMMRQAESSDGEVSENMSALTFVGTFVGGGLIGALITAASDSRLNRQAIDAQLQAEQRSVAARILVHFQRAKDALSVVQEGESNASNLIRAINVSIASGNAALELMPEVSLTVTDDETRAELVSFLRVLASILNGPVATALETIESGSAEDFLAMSQELKRAGEELDRHYGKALSAAIGNLGTDSSKKKSSWGMRAKRG